MKLDTGYDGDYPPSFSWKDSVAGKTWVGGTITHIGEPMQTDDQYKPSVTQEVFAIILDDEHTLWVTSKKDIERNPRPDRKYQAIAAAVQAAGADELLEGGNLQIKHASDRDTGKGNAEKIYEATYTPPAKGMVMASSAVADDQAPF
jgi:hypothetical protein